MDFIVIRIGIRCKYIFFLHLRSLKTVSMLGYDIENSLTMSLSIIWYCSACYVKYVTLNPLQIPVELDCRFFLKPKNGIVLKLEKRETQAYQVNHFMDIPTKHSIRQFCSPVRVKSSIFQTICVTYKIRTTLSLKTVMDLFFNNLTNFHFINQL